MSKGSWPCSTHSRCQLPKTRDHRVRTVCPAMRRRQRSLVSRNLTSAVTACRRVAQQTDCTLVPFQEMFDQAIQQAPPDYWAADGVHPTMAGHAADGQDLAANDAADRLNDASRGSCDRTHCGSRGTGHPLPRSAAVRTLSGPGRSPAGLVHQRARRVGLCTDRNGQDPDRRSRNLRSPACRAACLLHDAADRPDRTEIAGIATVCRAVGLFSR